MVALRTERLIAQPWARIGVAALTVLAAAGLAVSLGAGAAVLVHPPLFSDFRPWWPLLAGVGLASTAAGYWLLWGRRSA